MAKKAVKKTKPQSNDILAKLHDAAGRLQKLARGAKRKYDNLSEADKKKILIGAAGLAALAGGIIGGKKIAKKLKKKD